MDIKDKATDLFGTTVEVGVPMACELIFNGVVGTLAPGVINVVLAYKQKRQEKMYSIWLDELKIKVNELEEALKGLTATQYYEMKEKYFGIVSDFVLNEVQEEKIKFIVNGFINIAKVKEINENFVLTYYDTLQQLRIIDIAVLKVYGQQKIYLEIINEFSIDDNQYRATKEKLERLGLLITKRDEKENDLYNNIMVMQDFLLKSSKGKATKFPTLKRLEKTDSYKISKYGKEFLNFFIE